MLLPQPQSELPSSPQPSKKRWWKRWWGILIIIVVVLFVLFFGYVTYLIISGQATSSLENPNHFTVSSNGDPSARVDNSRLVRDNSPSLGLSTAKVTIVEFADFECPYCKESYPTIRELAAKYSNNIYYVYRYFPVTSLHEHAEAAAEAAACAAAQGKFWAYHDRLYQNQDYLDSDSLRVYAASIGADLTAFDSCVSAHTYQSLVARDVADGTAVGVRGTPTWFINGYKVEGSIPPDTFKSLIDGLLQAK